MAFSKVNITTIILVLGTILTSLLAIERVRLGARPGLGLVTAGMLIPLVILSYSFRDQHILENFKGYMKRRAELKLVKQFMIGFAYIGVLFTVGYDMYTNFSFLLGWFVIITPFASYALLRLLKSQF